jgi:hypothetical protein
MAGKDDVVCPVAERTGEAGADGHGKDWTARLGETWQAWSGGPAWEVLARPGVAWLIFLRKEFCENEDFAGNGT